MGCFPYMRLRSHSGQQFLQAQALFERISEPTGRGSASGNNDVRNGLLLPRGPRSTTGLRLRISPFCVAALASGLTED